MSLEEQLAETVEAAVLNALAPYLRKLAEPEKLVMSVPEAAGVLGVSPSTVRRWVTEGILPVLPYTERNQQIPKAAVHKLVEDTMTRPRSVVSRSA